jgi:hypothetical protein
MKVRGGGERIQLPPPRLASLSQNLLAEILNKILLNLTPEEMTIQEGKSISWLDHVLPAIKFKRPDKAASIDRGEAYCSLAKWAYYRLGIDEPRASSPLVGDPRMGGEPVMPVSSFRRRKSSVPRTCSTPLTSLFSPFATRVLTERGRCPIGIKEEINGWYVV